MFGWIIAVYSHRTRKASQFSHYLPRIRSLLCGSRRRTLHLLRTLELAILCVFIGQWLDPRLHELCGTRLERDFPQGHEVLLKRCPAAVVAGDGVRDMSPEVKVLNHLAPH